MLNIGYACQVAGYRDYTIKSCRLDKATGATIKQLTAENLETLSRMLLYCKDNDIPMFRISSDIIPFGSHPAVANEWWQHEAWPLAELGRFVIDHRLRVSMHPGQYTVLNSPHDDVVQRAVLDLAYHARFLDSMKLPLSHKIVLHIGGAYGDKKTALERFIENAKSLPENILGRLVLENDEKLFTIQDVLYAADILQLPVVLDTLHFALNPCPEMDVNNYINHCASTWREQDGRQKIHYSQQRKHAPRGSHSHTIDVDAWLIDSKSWTDLDVMLEVKDKNLSAIKCNCITNHCSRNVLEQQWDRYKYLIMRHSQEHDQQLSDLLQSEISAVSFYHLIDEALTAAPNDKTIDNAARSMWRYFIDKEKPEQFLSLLEKYGHRPQQAGRIFNYLYRLAKKHNEKKLLDGYSFYEI